MLRRWMMLAVAISAMAQTPVPTAPPAAGAEQGFRDSRYGVRFRVPPGWHFTRKDREVSTFRLDARSAPPRVQMRGVAAMEFNPYPLSTLSGALVYYSVERHSSEAECVGQARPRGTSADTQDIGGMSFVHGHDEHGGMCVEARDEVYTAYRKGSCYRFDLEMNTFCAQASGARELTDAQMDAVRGRMEGILSTVTLDWAKRTETPVPPPEDRRPLVPGDRRSGGL